MKKPPKPRSQRLDRRLGSKQEILAKATKLLRRRLSGKDDTDIALPLPTRVKIEDRDGCNWYMQWSERARGHGAIVQAVVEQIRATWNLE